MRRGDIICALSRQIMSASYSQIGNNRNIRFNAQSADMLMATVMKKAENRHHTFALFKWVWISSFFPGVSYILWVTMGFFLTFSLFRLFRHQCNAPRDKTRKRKWYQLTKTLVAPKNQWIPLHCSENIWLARREISRTPIWWLHINGILWFILASFIHQPSRSISSWNNAHRINRP